MRGFYVKDENATPNFNLFSNIDRHIVTKQLIVIGAKHFDIP